MEHNEPRKTPVSRRIFTWLLVTTLVLLGLHLLLQGINLDIYHQQHGQFYELSNRFDFDDESSVPTWFAQFLYLLIAAGAALAAYLQPAKSVRLLWAVISAVALLFSIDEIAGLHEYLLQTLHVVFYENALPGALANAWLIITPFVLIIAALFLGLMYKRFPKRTVILFGLAVVTFLVGAAGVDIIASVIEREESLLNQGLVVGLEETMEMLSLIIVIYAIDDYLERKHHAQLSIAFKALRRTN